MEVSVQSEDVSTFLMFAPEEEYLGAKVTGFVPREDGGLSALEMHGQVRSGGTPGAFSSFPSSISGFSVRIALHQPDRPATSVPFWRYLPCGGWICCCVYT